MPRRVRSLAALIVACTALVVSARWQSERSDPETVQPGDGLLPVLKPGGDKFWKGNLHTHSFWSDGDDFPEMIADWYKRHHYDFLALSDHNVLAEGERWLDISPAQAVREVALKKYAARFGPQWVERREHEGKAQVRLKPLAEFRSMLEEPGRFLLIPAEEVTHKYAKAPVHMNAINLRDVVKPINGANVSETIRVNHRNVYDQNKRTSDALLVSLNHPNFGWGVRAEDLAPVDELRFFEVFNGHPGVRNYGDEVHVSSEKMWDIVLALRLGKHHLPPIFGLATDDAHGYHTFGVGKVNPGRGWVMIRAPYLSAEAVVRAMKAGEFYASSGITLRDIRRDKNRLLVSIKAEADVTYVTQFIATMRDTPLTAEPRLDAQKQPVTGVYSADVGKVVAEVRGPEAAYELTGKELYVRAKVISSRPHPNPYQKGDVEMAWLQPVVP